MDKVRGENMCHVEKKESRQAGKQGEKNKRRESKVKNREFLSSSSLVLAFGAVLEASSITRTPCVQVTGSLREVGTFDSLSVQMENKGMRTTPNA